MLASGHPLIIIQKEVLLSIQQKSNSIDLLTYITWKCSHHRSEAVNSFFKTLDILKVRHGPNDSVVANYLHTLDVLETGEPVVDINHMTREHRMDRGLAHFPIVEGVLDGANTSRSQL
jgi:hypothetical protein